MTPREIRIPDLPRIARSLFTSHCIVAITPAAGDYEWAADAAWKMARAATTTGRRTALVDLNLENPILHNQAAKPLDTGIVDAFVFGASLQHVASHEENPNFHFIGVGSAPADPIEVWSSARWLRLAKGFEKEEAILLLYIPPAALEHLPFTPDLLIAASPRGFGPDGPKSHDVRAIVERGVPFVVLREGPEHAPVPQDQAVGISGGPPEPASSSPRRGASPLRRILLPVIGVLVTVMVTASILLLSRGEGYQSESRRTSPPDALDTSPESRTPVAPPLEDSIAPSPEGGRAGPVSQDALSRVDSTATDSAAVMEADVPPHAASDSVQLDETETPLQDSLTPHHETPMVADSSTLTEAGEPAVQDVAESPGPQDAPTTPENPDSLFYSVQVAAWPSLSQAVDHIGRFFRAGLPATIAAVPRDTERVWYRVLVGAVSDASAADSLRRRLRNAGLVGRTRVILAKTPYAFLLATHQDMDSARAATTGLRESGIPAYIVSMPNGSARVLVGAFDSPNQAELVDSVLPLGGRDLSRILVSRVGIAR